MYEFLQVTVFVAMFAAAVWFAWTVINTDKTNKSGGGKSGDDEERR